MKLFWKLFFSMVLMTILFCSTGGHFLIYNQFENAMEKEVEGIFEENDFLCHMVMQERKAHPLEEIAVLTEKLNLSVGQRNLYFRICDSDGKEIGGNGQLPVESLPLIGRLTKEQQGWELTKKEPDKIYLHGAAAMSLGEKTVFLENYKDVSAIYEERQQQQKTFYNMMGLFVLLTAMLSFFVVRFILKPVTLLSETTRKIAGGELWKRVEVNSGDELGCLSKDFNSMAERLEQKIGELEEAALRQEEFMGSFAHEMKTPLTSIIGYADMLRSLELKPEKVRENADYIFKEGQRLENLSGKMMELIVLGKEEMDLKKVSAAVLFQRLKGEMEPILGKEGIHLSVRWEDGIFLAEEDLMITVCLNLLDNGRKAIIQRRKDGGENGKKDGLLKLQGFCKPDGYRICVTDNGKGIPKEELERVKEAFYMVDKSRARAMGGAGLGLSICDKIISLHGGEFRIESRLGEGTWIEIKLPGLPGGAEEK